MKSGDEKHEKPPKSPNALRTNLSFTDEDLDRGDVGSAATWELPEAPWGPTFRERVYCASLFGLW